MHPPGYNHNGFVATHIHTYKHTYIHTYLHILIYTKICITCINIINITY